MAQSSEVVAREVIAAGGVSVVATNEPASRAEADNRISTTTTEEGEEEGAVEDSAGEITISHSETVMLRSTFVATGL